MIFLNKTVRVVPIQGFFDWWYEGGLQVIDPELYLYGWEQPYSMDGKIHYSKNEFDEMEKYENYRIYRFGSKFYAYYGPFLKTKVKYGENGWSRDIIELEIVDENDKLYDFMECDTGFYAKYILIGSDYHYYNSKNECIYIEKNGIHKNDRK